MAVWTRKIVIKLVITNQFGLYFEGRAEELDRCVCTVRKGRERRKARPQCHSTAGWPIEGLSM